MYAQKLYEFFLAQHFQVKNSFAKSSSIEKYFLSDTLAERDSLIENVFPNLKDYCREKYGLEFQVCWLSF
jgi:hypothetical protein